MEKIILRNFKFEGKTEDFSKTYDYRILGTEKRNLDFIDEYWENVFLLVKQQFKQP